MNDKPFYFNEMKYLGNEISHIFIQTFEYFVLENFKISLKEEQ